MTGADFSGSIQLLFMRSLFFWFVLMVTPAIPFPAQAGERDEVMREFSGTGSTTTGTFKVQDRWEVRWNARRVVSIAVMSADGTIVAGASGVFRGSLFVPVGGQYYFKVSDGTVSPANGSQPAPAPPATSTSTGAAPTSLYGTPVQSPAVPSAPPPAAPSPADSENPSPSAGDSTISWHLQVVQLGTTVAPNQALTVYTPFFVPPDSVISPVVHPPQPPSPELTGDQTHTLVTIKGDNAQGNGFLMRSQEGTFVVTHLHLLAANPNVQLYTNSGVPIVVRSIKGATDRDLALFAIQDNHFNYLPLPTNATNAFAVGDQLIIPDIGQDAEAPPGVSGKVVATAPQRLDFDNAISSGSSGAPVIHVKSGSVLALVTTGKKVDLSDRIARAWPANSATDSGSSPFFGVKLTDVPGWETYDLSRFLAETTFLTKFHRDTRSLDNFLNGKHRLSAGFNVPLVRDNQDFLNNAKIHAAIDRYKQDFDGGDQDQQLGAGRELIYELGNIADTDMSTLERAANLYAYNQAWAREEIAYRNALKKELDAMGNHPSQIERIAQP